MVPLEPLDDGLPQNIDVEIEEEVFVEHLPHEDYASMNLHGDITEFFSHLERSQRDSKKHSPQSPVAQSVDTFVDVTRLSVKTSLDIFANVLMSGIGDEAVIVAGAPDPG